MDDQSHLDLSTEGTAPVFNSQPAVSSPDSEPILLPAPGPGPASTPISKRMKFLLGLFSAVILVSGLVTSLLLVKQKQDQRSKAFSPGNCRCSGTAWICENEQGGHDYMGERAGCGSGTPPESVETKVTDPNTGITTTTSQVTTFTDTAGNKTVETFTNTDTSNPNKSGGTNTNNTGGITVTTGGGPVVTNRNMDVPITSLCEIKTCTTRLEWENGANAIKNCGSNCHSLIEGELRAQNKLKDYVSGTNILDYVSSGKVALNTIYTDAVKDLDGDATNGIQVAELKRTCTGASNCTYTYGRVQTVTLNTDPSCKPGDNTCLTRNMSTRDEPNATVTTNSSGKIVINGLNPQLGTSGKYPGTESVTNLWNSTKCDTTSRGNGYECRDWGGKLFCTGDAETKLGVAKGSLTCNNANFQLSGRDYTFGSTVGGSRTYCNDTTDKKCSIEIKGDNVIRIYATDASGNRINNFYIEFNTKTGKIINASLPTLSSGQYYSAQLYTCDANKPDLYWNGQGCGLNPLDKNKSLTLDQLKTLTIGGKCGDIQQLDLDINGIGHVSINVRNVDDCGITTTTFTPTGGTPTGGGGNPPGDGSNPTPTPTTPTNPQLACYQLQIFRAGTQIQPWQINQGDALVFRGFASVSGGATVSRMRFTVTVGGVAQTPVDVNATLVGGLYQADYNYTITQNTSYSVTTLPL